MIEVQEKCKWYKNSQRFIGRGAVYSITAICLCEGITCHGYWDQPSGPASMADYEYVAHLPHTHTEYESNWISASGLAVFESTSRPYWHGAKFVISTSGPVKKT